MKSMIPREQFLSWRFGMEFGTNGTQENQANGQFDQAPILRIPPTKLALLE